MGAWSIGIKDPSDLDLKIMLAAVVEEERLSAPFAFIVARAESDWIDIAPILFPLWMHGGIAINLASRSLKYFCFQPFRQPEHINGANHAGLCGLHRITLIMDRRGWAGEVVDFINLHKERVRHVVPKE